MERLTERMDTARRALRSFEAVLRAPKTDIVRDAAINTVHFMNGEL